MSEVTSWKWWVSGFGVPLAAVFVAVGALYLQYLQYSKDINELRAQWQAENEAQVKRFQEIVEKQNRDLAERDRVIEKQKKQLDKFASNQPLTPPLSTPFQLDLNKYKYLFSGPAPPPPRTWREQVTGFVSDYWKILLFLGMILAAGLGKK